MAAVEVTAEFRPLDAAIVSEAIPAFFIGRNNEGFWIARDVKGQIGGIFLLENSALSFAKRNSWPAGCATIFPSERFELDLENKGNPLVAHLGTVDPSCNAPSAANGRPHPQNDESGQTPVARFSRPLKRGGRRRTTRAAMSGALRTIQNEGFLT